MTLGPNASPTVEPRVVRMPDVVDSDGCCVDSMCLLLNFGWVRNGGHSILLFGESQSTSKAKAAYSSRFENERMAYRSVRTTKAAAHQIISGVGTGPIDAKGLCAALRKSGGCR